jgi:hypothetical protein
MDNLPVLNTLWVEGPLSYLEKVCLKSAIKQGHIVILYTYYDVSGVPKGVEVRDGREIMSETYLMKHKKSNSWSLCSNIFRYFLMEQQRGVWIDTDVYFVRPLKTNAGNYVFGWQKDALLNGAVLQLPADSPLLNALIDFVHTPGIIPAWLPWRKKLRYQIRPWLGLRPLHLSELPWGVIGPRALTHFTKELGVTEYAMPQDVFYPLPPKQAKLLFEPDADIESYITERTVAIHFWNEIIKGLKHFPAPEGSFMARICAEHDVPMQ